MPVVSDPLLHAVDVIRSIQGPSAFGVVVTQVTVVQRVWFGGQVGSEGGTSDSSLPGSPCGLPMYYPVVPLSTRQVMGSGGQYEWGDIRVGPITPKFADTLCSPPVSGGFSEGDLHPVANVDGVEVIYVLTGRHAGEYQFVALESWDPTGYSLVLRRRIAQPVEPTTPLLGT